MVTRQWADGMQHNFRQAVLWELFPVGVAAVAVVVYFAAEHMIPRDASNPLSWVMLPILLVMGGCVLAYFLCGIGWARLGYTVVALALIVGRGLIVWFVVKEAAAHWIHLGWDRPLSPWFYQALVATLAIPVASAVALHVLRDPERPRTH